MWGNSINHLSRVFLLKIPPPVTTTDSHNCDTSGTCWLWQCCHHWNIGSCQALPPRSSRTTWRFPTAGVNVFSTLRKFLSSCSWIPVAIGKCSFNDLQSELKLLDYIHILDISTLPMSGFSWRTAMLCSQRFLGRHLESPKNSTGNSQCFQCKEVTEGLYTLRYDFYLLPCIWAETIRRLSSFSAVTMMLLWLTFSDVAFLRIQHFIRIYHDHVSNKGLSSVNSKIQKYDLCIYIYMCVYKHTYVKKIHSTLVDYLGK